MRAIDLLNGRLKLRHLVLVVAIADQGSVLRAAEHLRLAQPAVTRSLREVEHILGVELFTRGPRGVTPTMFGDAFVEHARTVLAELRRAGERISGLADGEVGTVTVSTQMAGRGTDIRLGTGAAERGGLLVLARGLYPSSRLDDQLRGRAGQAAQEHGLRFRRRQARQRGLPAVHQPDFQARLLLCRTRDQARGGVLAAIPRRRIGRECWPHSGQQENKIRGEHRNGTRLCAHGHHVTDLEAITPAGH